MIKFIVTVKYKEPLEDGTTQQVFDHYAESSVEALLEVQDMFPDHGAIKVKKADDEQDKV